MAPAVNYLVDFRGLTWYKRYRPYIPMVETGGASEPSPRKDVSGQIARRLDELAQVRGSEQAEQVATEKATGRPLPAALVLFRRVGEIEREYEAASLDQQPPDGWVSAVPSRPRAC